MTRRASIQRRRKTTFPGFCAGQAQGLRLANFAVLNMVNISILLTHDHENGVARRSARREHAEPKNLKIAERSSEFVENQRAKEVLLLSY